VSKQASQSIREKCAVDVVIKRELEIIQG
jgi:hypothetical protein